MYEFYANGLMPLSVKTALPPELQKRAARADQSVLFFLPGANFWEKHAKNCAIMSMAHITYAMLKTSLLSYCDYTGGTSSPWPTRQTQL